MIVVVYGSQMLAGCMRVDLRRGNVAVAQQDLNGP
jgi:hypothetical protein